MRALPGVERNSSTACRATWALIEGGLKPLSSRAQLWYAGRLTARFCAADARSAMCGTPRRRRRRSHTSRVSTQRTAIASVSARSPGSSGPKTSSKAIASFTSRPVTTPFRFSSRIDSRVPAATCCSAGGCARWFGAAATVALHVGDSAAERVVLQASRAVITVPLGVLQAGTIGITPRPEEVLSQAHRLVMGPVVRSTLVFEDRILGRGAPLRAPGCHGVPTCSN